MFEFPHRQFPGISVFPASTTLTSSFVAGNIVSMDEANMIAIDVTYTKGSETDLVIKVESTNDSPGSTGTSNNTGLTNSSNWYQQVTQSASGGTVTLAPALYQMTATSAATSQNFTLIINPIKGTGVRISAMYSGGSGPGTVQITAFTGWV